MEILVTRQNIYRQLLMEILEELMQTGERLSVDDCTNLNPQKSFTTDKSHDNFSEGSS